MAQILVVDDEPLIRSAFVELLSSRGHIVLPVVTAEDALVHLTAGPFDLVFLNLPARDERPGRLARIRRTSALTGAGDRDDRPGDHRDGHRGHQARGVRLPLEAL